MLIAVTLATAFFIGLIFAGMAFENRVCAICGAITGTWTVLVLLLYAGLYTNELVIGILMGQTIIGVWYVLRRSVPSRYMIYSLPFLLTATVIAYSILIIQIPFSAIMGVIGLWLVTAGVDVYREHERLRSTAAALIDCCRDW